MSESTKELQFSLFSLLDFESAEVVGPLVDRLAAAPIGLRPTKYGYNEPEMAIGDRSAIIDMITRKGHSHTGERSSGASLGGRDCNYQIRWTKLAHPYFSLLFGSLALRRSADQQGPLVEAYCTLFRDLISRAGIAYAEMRDLSTPHADVPMDPTIRLPEIPAISVYGLDYVRMFGEDALRSAPFARIERLPGGEYWLEASTPVLGLASEERKSAIRRHLGEDAFASGGKRLYRSGRAPRFDMSSLLP